ncbi:YcnI family copper-binding membrane protein [Massilia rhizosphaerae]|uniref:YcnI family copper-binding membrane protein n=1 Tax=Massilia rhizosphaerae TaxID=2784389 RepID=UPI0018DE5F2F|nr:YcnI family protein [Massilia rhizosphaerae]
MKAIWIAALCAAPLAHAHITVAPASAPAGAYQTLVFKVGHGCDGSATTAITVSLPEGVTAKPMPKPGWTLDLVEGKLATPLQAHGKTVTRAVREITWRGGPLPDAYYDEFTVQAKLPDAPGRYAFKVGQQCEKGRVDWVDAVPGSKTPAPVLEVVPAAMPPHHH